MSDYLGRLAARTIAPQSVAARPRIASAYEMVSAPVVTTERIVALESPAGHRPAAPAPRPVTTQEPPITIIKQETADLKPIATGVRTSRPHSANGNVRNPQSPPIERVEPIETRETLETTREHEHTIIERRQRVERLNVRRERVIERVVEAQAQPAPIEITINRIDVRAAVAAPAEAPRPKRPAVMTLEEYVARRDGERR